MNNAETSLHTRIIQISLRKADEFAKKIPVPAAVRRHISKKDAAFIAAAYAIPLPGTALFAAALVGCKHGGRFLRGRVTRGAAADAV